jgi:uncharacterized OsmC-like protein
LDLKSIQRPLRERYTADPAASKITLRAKGSETGTPLGCSIDIGRAIYHAEAHSGVGGTGAAACSGDLLLGALAACAQITCQMVATSMGLSLDSVAATVEGDLDLRGTLGLSKDVPVGFESIRLRFDLRAPGATADQLRSLQEKTERYCVVAQTLLRPPKLHTDWACDSKS